MTDPLPTGRLRVICSQSELQEYGEVIRVGQTVSREAARREGAFFGGALDRIEWGFDRYARLVGHDAATIGGRVTAIHAVFVRLEHQHDGTWAPRPGSAQLEGTRSTADTREVEEEWEPGASFPDGRGGVWASRVPLRQDGDECFTGWVFALEGSSVEPLPSP